MSTLISDMVGFALAQRPCGAPGKFRQALQILLSVSAIVIPSPPPPEYAPDMVHRDRILDLFLPDNAPGRLRKVLLRKLLTGNLASPDIVIFSTDPAWPRSDTSLHTLTTEYA